MGNLLEALQNHLKNTPQDILEQEWKEIEYLNEIGPDVIEYAKNVREYYGISMSYSNIETNIGSHKFNVSECTENNLIVSNAKYYFAA